MIISRIMTSNKFNIIVHNKGTFTGDSKNQVLKLAGEGCARAQHCRK